MNRLLFRCSGELVTGEGRDLFPSTTTKTLTSSLCEVRWTERGGQGSHRGLIGLTCRGGGLTWPVMVNWAPRSPEKLEPSRGSLET